MDAGVLELWKLEARMHTTQIVFTLRAGDELLAVAQVAPPILDHDPELPNLGVPARLRMVAAVEAGHGHGLRLVEEIRSQVFTDLVHDGCLSIAGEALVARVGLAMELGKSLYRVNVDRAVELAADLIDFALQNPAGTSIG